MSAQGIESGATFPLLTAEGLLSLPEPSWLIDGLLPASGLSVLYGAAKTGKSFVALDWALCVACGLPWLGREVNQRPVLYIAAEGHAGLGARYRAWRESRGHPDAGDIFFLPSAVNLRDRKEVERARRTLASLPERPGLLVVDTMARSMVGGDENAAKDVGEFIASLDDLRQADAALVVHHAGKDGGGERGSSALRGAADLLAKLERDGRGANLTLSCVALKDAAEWDDSYLTLERSSVGSCVLSRRVEKETASDDLRERVLHAIANGQFTSKNAVAKRVDGRRQDVLDALGRLEGERQIRKLGGVYEVVPRGPEPPGNHLSAAPGGGGSGEEHPPVGGAPGEPPSADQFLNDSAGEASAVASSANGHRAGHVGHGAGATVAERESAVVAQVASAFDAAELGACSGTIDDARSDWPPCGYASHRGRRWRLRSGGPVICGICHPPAVLDIEELGPPGLDAGGGFDA